MPIGNPGWIAYHNIGQFLRARKPKWAHKVTQHIGPNGIAAFLIKLLHKFKGFAHDGGVFFANAGLSQQGTAQ